MMKYFAFIKKTIYKCNDRPLSVLVDKTFCDKTRNYRDITKNLSESNKKKPMNKHTNFEIIVLLWLIYKRETSAIEHLT